LGLVVGGDGLLAGYAAMSGEPDGMSRHRLALGPSGAANELREADGPRLIKHRLDCALDGDGITCQVLVSGSIVEVNFNNEVAISYQINGDFQ
jgi:hypothetical protein